MFYLKTNAINYFAKQKYGYACSLLLLKTEKEGLTPLFYLQ